MADCFLMRKGNSMSPSEMILSFKNSNLLLEAIPSSPQGINIQQTDSKVLITIPDGSNPEWFELFKNIDLKINTFYKLSVNTFGYGRIGISNQNGSPHNGVTGSSSTITTNTNACVFSKAVPKDDEIAGDNYLITNDNYSAYFIINLNTGSDTIITQSSSIWFCNDLALDNNERKGYSFEIVLQEQDIIKFGDDL